MLIDEHKPTKKRKKKGSLIVNSKNCIYSGREEEKKTGEKGIVFYERVQIKLNELNVKWRKKKWNESIWTWNFHVYAIIYMYKFYTSVCFNSFFFSVSLSLSLSVRYCVKCAENMYAKYPSYLCIPLHVLKQEVNHLSIVP